jgi:hypothetical protein
MSLHKNKYAKETATTCRPIVVSHDAKRIRKDDTMQSHQIYQVPISLNLAKNTTEHQIQADRHTQTRKICYEVPGCSLRQRNRALIAVLVKSARKPT